MTTRTETFDVPIGPLTDADLGGMEARAQDAILLNRSPGALINGGHIEARSWDVLRLVQELRRRAEDYRPLWTKGEKG